MSRINRDVAEDLEVDVPVQLLKQFWKAQLGVHLQEHQGDLPLRREVGFTPKFRPQALAYQAEALCHLAQRKEFLYPTEVRILEGCTVEFIKIELGERNVGRFFSKILYF